MACGGLGICYTNSGAWAIPIRSSQLWFTWRKEIREGRGRERLRGKLNKFIRVGGGRNRERWGETGEEREIRNLGVRQEKG